VIIVALLDFLVVPAFLVVLAFWSLQLSSHFDFSMVTALKNTFTTFTFG
jgi:hypothetical protein